MVLPPAQFHGQVFLFYLIGYSIYRFIVEFFRETVIFYGFYPWVRYILWSAGDSHLAVFLAAFPLCPVLV